MSFAQLPVFFCLLSAFATCSLGFFVFSRDPDSGVHRLFLASMLGMSGWALGEFFIWESGTYAGVLFWLKASAFWPVAIILTVHFVLAFTDHPLLSPGRRNLTYVALYLPALFFTLAGLLTDSLYVAARTPAGYAYVPAAGSPVLMASDTFIVIAVAIAILAAYTAFRHAESGQKRRQIRLLCLAIITAVFFGALSGLVLPAIGIALPNLVFIGAVLFSLIITYAITQYGLFTLSPETAVPYILRTMPDGLVLADRNGRIVTANDSASGILQPGSAGITGNAVSAVLPEPAYATIMKEIGRRGSFSDLEITTGTGTVVSIAGAPVTDTAGEPAGTVLILRDISGRKMQERALRMANEKISLLGRTTRHDINNLVSGLSSYLTLLEDSVHGEEEKTYVAGSLDIVKKIDRQIRFSGEYLRIGTFQPDWLPFADLVARARDDLPPSGVRIITTIPGVEIYADPLAMKVFYTLFENAIRHGSQLTAITVSVAEQPDGCLVALFEDDGGGVPEADKERIFQYGVGKHTGLGLALSRDILSLTGITIRETGVAGTGARFEIHFPAGAWRQAQ